MDIRLPSGASCKSCGDVCGGTALIGAPRETAAPRWNVDLIDRGIEDRRQARINNLILTHVAVSSWLSAFGLQGA
jgi:hypothetical protein